MPVLSLLLGGPREGAVLSMPGDTYTARLPALDLRDIASGRVRPKMSDPILVVEYVRVDPTQMWDEVVGPLIPWLVVGERDLNTALIVWLKRLAGRHVDSERARLGLPPASDILSRAEAPIR